ncbi:MAG: APC family permease [Bacillota bacterium]|nr:APC family permease [Bacillota bacterium]
MEPGKLKKNSLNIFETLALSVAIMGPSASISVTVILMAFYAGCSSPLIFLISMVCIGLISVSIIALNKYFPSSGSVYNFAEKTLGRRTGFISGWLIVFTYLMLGVSCSAIAASTLQSILDNLGIQLHWGFIIIILMALVWYLAGRNAKLSTRILLVLEVISMSIILLLSIVIIVKTASTTGLSIAPFKPGNNSFSSIAGAVVFGFLAFSGFEGASSLGEESRNPKKMIPLAVAGSIIISGIFYILVSYAQVLGFGATPGMQALTATDAPLADLALKYLSGSISIIIMLCVSISFFATTLGCVSAGARILYTMGRDGMLHKSLCRTNSRHNTPSVGINILVIVSVLIFAGCITLKAIDIGRYAATVGTLALVLSYLLANVCALVFFNKNKIWKGIKLILPVVSILILGFVFYLNVYPEPEFPLNLFPYVVILWIVVGIILSLRLKKKQGTIT